MKLGAERDWEGNRNVRYYSRWGGLMERRGITRCGNDKEQELIYD